MQKKVLITIKMLAGLMLIVFGSNKFFGFLEMSPGTLEMGIVMKALFSTGYMMQLIAAIEIAAGLAFILNKYVALMAVVLLPVMLNALLMHFFLDPAGIGGSAMLTAMTLIIMFDERSRYQKILKP